MNVNDLIASAFSSGGQMVGADLETFVLEGNPATNDLRIVTGEIYILNTYLYATGAGTG